MHPKQTTIGAALSLCACNTALYFGGKQSRSASKSLTLRALETPNPLPAHTVVQDHVPGVEVVEGVTVGVEVIDPLKERSRRAP